LQSKPQGCGASVSACCRDIQHKKGINGTILVTLLYAFIACTGTNVGIPLPLSSTFSQNASSTYFEKLKGKDLSVGAEIVYSTFQDRRRQCKNVDRICLSGYRSVAGSSKDGDEISVSIKQREGFDRLSSYPFPRITFAINLLICGTKGRIFVLFCSKVMLFLHINSPYPFSRF
jgi:hypothetical protein